MNITIPDKQVEQIANDIIKLKNHIDCLFPSDLEDVHLKQSIIIGLKNMYVIAHKEGYVVGVNEK